MANADGKTRDETWQEWEGTGDNRPSVYAEGGKLIFRASALGNCLKSLVAIGMGMSEEQAPQVIRRAWAEGHRNEDVILNLLRTQELGQESSQGIKAGVQWKMLDDHDIEYGGYGQVVEGQLEVEYPVSRGVVRGHTDGIGQIYARKDEWANVQNRVANAEFPGMPGVGTRAVVEAKAFAESSWKKFQSQGMDAFPYYKMQNSIYMLATGLPLLFVIGVKDKEGVVQEIHTFFYTDPWFNKGKVKARTAKIARLIDAGDLPETCEYKMYPCSVYYLHDDESETPVSVTGDNDDDAVPEVDVLRGMLVEFAEAKAKEAAAKKAKESGEAILKKWIADHPEMAGKDLLIDAEGGKVKLNVSVGGLKEVKHEAVPETIIPAHTIPAVEVPEQVIPAKEAYTEMTGTKRVTIKAEVIGQEEGK